MTSPWIPTHEQLKECFKAIKKNFNYGRTTVKCSCQLHETNNEKKQALLLKTSDWDYGKDADPKKTSELGAKSVLCRLDSNGMRRELLDVMTIHNENCDIYKTASYLLSVIDNTHRFWLLKKIDHSNGDKIFFHNDHNDIRVSGDLLLGEFNLYEAIGDRSDVINEDLYHSELCVYYHGKRYSFWMIRSGRSSLGISIQGVRHEYRPSHCPAILVDIDSNLYMVLCASEIIDNTKHIGYGYCNIIKKSNRKGKGSGIITGHSIIDIWMENMRDVHVEFYAVDRSIVSMNDITVQLEWDNLKENGQSIVLKTQPLQQTYNGYNDQSYSQNSTAPNDINNSSNGTMSMAQNDNNHQVPNGPLPLPPIEMIMQDILNNTNTNPQQTEQGTVTVVDSISEADTMTVLSTITNTTTLYPLPDMEASSLYGGYHTAMIKAANMRFNPMGRSRF